MTLEGAFLLALIVLVLWAQTQTKKGWIGFVGAGSAIIAYAYLAPDRGDYVFYGIVAVLFGGMVYFVTR